MLETTSLFIKVSVIYSDMYLPGTLFIICPGGNDSTYTHKNQTKTKQSKTFAFKI